jgi:hypothetical protein
VEEVQWVVQLMWTNREVTRVTTERVTHGTLVHVAGIVNMLTWQKQVATRQWIDWVMMVDQSLVDTWHALGKWGGAMWPRRGLPHGTPSLVTMLKKILWSSWGSTPRPVCRGKVLWRGPTPSHHTYYLII